jgi:hypothetical protein
MSVRHVARKVATAFTATAAVGVLSMLAFAPPAGATTPTQGSTVPNSAVPDGSYTPGTPFSSGQNINVVVPANSLFSSSTNLQVIECTAPGGVDPTLSSACDGNTVQGQTLTSNADGSVNMVTETKTPYPIYALPDAISLDETSGPVCSLSVECVLYIGYNVNSFTAPHVWSQPFYVASNADDGGENPGDGTPEVPYAVLLPISAMGVIGSVVLIRRRKAARA